MSLRALLMRVFLIVALLANGPGIAGAAMHMDYLRDSAGDVTSVAAAQTRSEAMAACHGTATRSEEHTSELQSLMRISYAVFCLKKKTNNAKYKQIQSIIE